MILLGPEDRFNAELSKLTGLELVGIDRRTFPDGELCPRVLGEVKGSDVLLSMRMRAGEGRPNDYLVEVLFTIRNLREHLGAGRIVALMPYFPYARQDAIFRPGEPLSSRYVAEFLESAGADMVISVTTHTHRTGRFQDLFESIEAADLNGFRALAEQLGKLNLGDPFILGPDTESINWARMLAESMNLDEYDAFRKERDLNTGEIRTTVKDIQLDERTVIVVDDMVSTGGTMARAIEAARRMGAKLVISAFVHPVMAPGAIEKIIGAGADLVIASDTLEWPASRATVTGLIAEYIKGEVLP